MIPIGLLSRRAGVHIETIRYYERTRILPKAARGGNGRRQYDDDDVRRLTFIRQARELGFDLDSVRGLLALQANPDNSCAVASELAKAQLAAVEGRIRRLEALRMELKKMVNACNNGRVADCCVMDALAKKSRRPIEAFASFSGLSGAFA